MKREDSFQEIADLLRSQTPDPLPPPGLESRILRALENQQRTKPTLWWPWLLLPPAFAALLIMMPRPADPPPAAPIAKTSFDESTPAEPTIYQMLAANPLKSETSTLGRDAERAGDFLIDCLPSIRSE